MALYFDSNHPIVIECMQHNQKMAKIDNKFIALCQE
jgi:hypothetical protein